MRPRLELLIPRVLRGAVRSDRLWCLRARPTSPSTVKAAPGRQQVALGRGECAWAAHTAGRALGSWSPVSLRSRHQQRGSAAAGEGAQL